MSDDRTPIAVVVGAGFAGIGAARELAKHGVRVVLVERNDYHQFQPLLYQVATAGLARSDVASSLRTLMRRTELVDVKAADVASVDPAERSVTALDGTTFTGDYLILAAGSQPNFFDTAGADEHSIPLYSVNDAERLRTRVFAAFDAADRDPSLVDRGVVRFVVIGGGPTGVEVAGALAELIHDVLPHQYRGLAVRSASVHLVDHAPTLLGPFSDSAHDYAAKILQRKGVRLHLGTGVVEVRPDKVVLSDGTALVTRTVIWAGGVMAASLAERTGLPVGRGGRLLVEHDLTVDDAPGVYAVGDVANVPAPDGSPYPQLGSVALQSGQWAARNVVADIRGHSRKPFHYHDKGIMAMIGRGAAVAEIGEHRHELHGPVAFASWLGVHAYLMSGVRTRADAFISWGWDYFSTNRAPAIVDRSDARRIDWGEDEDEPTTDADQADTADDGHRVTDRAPGASPASPSRTARPAGRPA